MTQEIQAILADVGGEVGAQLVKWGVQNHPTWSDGGMTAKGYGTSAVIAQQTNDLRVEGQRLAWDGILLEEVYEALAETDAAKRRAELVQVAAVAVTMIDQIDRGRGGPGVCVDTPVDGEYDDCGGEVTLGPDPYVAELCQDYTPVWLCAHHHANRAEAI